MANDRSAGSDAFKIGGQGTGGSSQFMVNDRTGGSSAYQMDPNEKSIGSAQIMIGQPGGSQASSAFMVNDRTGGAESFSMN
mgnify:CR=1 FL=1